MSHLLFRRNISLPLSCSFSPNISRNLPATAALWSWLVPPRFHAIKASIINARRSTYALVRFGGLVGAFDQPRQAVA